MTNTPSPPLPELPDALFHLRFGYDAEQMQLYALQERENTEARMQSENRALREALQLAVRQNSHDMQMTGEEIRLCEAALSSTGGAE